MVPFIVYTVATGLINMFIMAACLDNGDVVGLQWINPIVIYNNVHVNWFGCIVLTILAHIVAGPWVVFYWFYKLCTVGRK